MDKLNRKLDEKFLTHLQGALDSSPACVIIAEAPSGNIIYINEAVVAFRGDVNIKHTNLKIEEYVKTWKEYSADGKLLLGEEMPLGRAILFGEVVDRQEIIVELDNGIRKWALASASPIYNNKKEIIAGSVIWYDISGQKHIEKKLREMAEFDFLTRVYSRQHLLDLANRMFIRTKQDQSSLLCMMFDIDYFKSINDKYGHKAGDIALVAFSEIASKNIRSNDLFGRIGGEEFLAVLPEVTLDVGKKLAERIRAEVEKTPVITETADITMTVSIGISIYEKTMNISTFDELTELSDKALYAAKHSGRNRVYVNK